MGSSFQLPPFSLSTFSLLLLNHSLFPFFHACIVSSTLPPYSLRSHIKIKFKNSILRASFYKYFFLISLVILSQNYASSTCCLDELQKILDSKRSLGRQVISIFYKIDPSHVRHQSGPFATAFQNLSEKFAENKDKVQRWRDALEEAANISGYDTRDQ